MKASPLRVLVVDDTAVYRKIVAETLRALPDVEVVGTAVNGRIALEKLDELRPDLLTLDLEMPELDGIGVLKRLREVHPSPGAIMLSAFTSAGASATTKALGLGAFDFVLKPNGADVEANARQLRKQLQDKVAAFAISRASPQRQSVSSSDRPLEERHMDVDEPTPTNNNSVPAVPIEAIVIGVSTGGPDALSRLLPALPADLRVPMLIVQHMPPIFTKSLADDLNRRCKLHVVEAVEGQTAEAGTVYFAPGGKQMRIERHAERLLIRITDDPPENSCRPAADYLFRSAARQLGPAVLAVIMTGMGSDGTLGLRLLKREGAMVVAQDRASCVVFGMPAQPIAEGLADIVSPLDSLADHIVRCAGRRSSL